MDKKKVEELIEKTIRFTKVTDDDYIQGNVKSHIINTLQVALKELSRSDWVSVEDGLPPYGEEVFVTSKMAPDNVFKNRRVECTTVPKDGNDFIILWEGRMARITHWKPIKKLEDWAMDRNEAKGFYPILQAFAEGRIIECRTKPSTLSKSWQDMNDWTELEDITYWNNIEYRIKPEPKYRPFKNAEECWNEMQKHQPFGVVKDKYFANYQIHRAFTCLVTNGCDFGGYEDETFESNFKNLLFVDGTPFGVKVEE